MLGFPDRSLAEIEGRLDRITDAARSHACEEHKGFPVATELSQAPSRALADL